MWSDGYMILQHYKFCDTPASLVGYQDNQKIVSGSKRRMLHLKKHLYEKKNVKCILHFNFISHFYVTWSPDTIQTGSLLSFVYHSQRHRSVSQAAAAWNQFYSCLTWPFWRGVAGVTTELQARKGSKICGENKETKPFTLVSYTLSVDLNTLVDSFEGSPHHWRQSNKPTW